MISFLSRLHKLETSLYLHKDCPIEYKLRMDCWVNNLCNSWYSLSETQLEDFFILASQTLKEDSHEE